MVLKSVANSGHQQWLTQNSSKQDSNQYTKSIHNPIVNKKGSEMIRHQQQDANNGKLPT